MYKITPIPTDLLSPHPGNIPLTIGYDIRVYEGVNITIDCSPLVQAHGGGNITWHSQLINPRAVIRNEPEQPLPDTSVELVVPSTSIPIFLQESFRCEVCSSHCWSNNSIISVVCKWYFPMQGELGNALSIIRSVFFKESPIYPSSHRLVHASLDVTIDKYLE